MEKMKFTLLSIVTIVVVGAIGYWSFSTMQSGSEHASNEKMKQLQTENADLKKEITKLTDDLYLAQSKIDESVIRAEEEAKTDKTTPTVYKNQSLINSLQKLIDNRIYMKLRSGGTRVGTVQKFLNIYNNTSKTVDNDYGPGTVTMVKAFQKAEGLTSDGEAGVNTFKKMIDWLKKQG